jgi:hypothetical protein|tara:strand:- start:775 stop:978 length:204 start_codon:yes stop_codon:yes gene_type:complete
MNPIELNKLNISEDLTTLLQTNEFDKKIKSEKSILINLLILGLMTTTITLIIKYINNEREKRFYSRD